jgi:hypothetical protein
MKSRPEMPPKCPEIKGLFKAVRIVFLYALKTRPLLLEELKKLETKKVIRISSQREWNECFKGAFTEEMKDHYRSQFEL